MNDFFRQLVDQSRTAWQRFNPLQRVVVVAVPLLLLQLRGEAGSWTATGTIWSLIAGAAGALGALGVILAFRFGGNPIYVMPLVFGLAPVINTFVSMSSGTTRFVDASPFFYAGLIIVAVGAVVVLVFAPKPKALGHAPSAPAMIAVAICGPGPPAKSVNWISSPTFWKYPRSFA